MLLDLGLPHPVDGFRVLESLRKEGYDLPVAVVTGYCDAEVRIRSFRLGADQFLVKPELDELLACAEGTQSNRVRRTSGGHGAVRMLIPERSQQMISVPQPLELVI